MQFFAFPLFAQTAGRLPYASMSSSRRASLKRATSTTSLLQSQTDDVPSGPLSGPSRTRWRRDRLLSIGTERPEEEDGAAAVSPDSAHTNYGTMPPVPRPQRSKSKLDIRRGIASLQGLVIPKGSYSTPATPGGTSPISFVEHLSYLRERPISAYDKPNYSGSQEPVAAEGDVKTNGIRVWYSSFTSIDWLHDSIKDSARQARLRRRKSVRGKSRRALDRTIGWLVVSIVGFLTAVIAFLITRSEQWLFDFKEGYCEGAWHKSKRFCCPTVDDDQLVSIFLSGPEVDPCPGWRPWADVFGPAVDGSKWLMLEAEMVEYIAYIVVAVSSNIPMIITLSLNDACDSLSGPSSPASSPSSSLRRPHSRLAKTPVSCPRRLPAMAKRPRPRRVNQTRSAKSCTM